ncbi:MAG: DUF5320 domain-containing protein [Candidatus Delongbacteria bacterium]
MPRGDRTGPNGAGQMTGRGLGYCAGYDEPGFTAGGRGLGRGYGRGYGAGYGRAYSPVHPDVTEKTLLENEIRVLKDQMTALEKRLSETEDK